MSKYSLSDKDFLKDFYVDLRLGMRQLEDDEQVKTELLSFPKSIQLEVENKLKNLEQREMPTLGVHPLDRVEKFLQFNKEKLSEKKQQIERKGGNAAIIKDIEEIENRLAIELQKLKIREKTNQEEYEERSRRRKQDLDR